MSDRPAMRRGNADHNQKQIAAALRQVGATVHLLHSVGNGCPDLLVGYRGKTVLMEVKNPDGRGSILTPQQEAWFRAWNGGTAVVVSSASDAFSVLGID